MLDRKISAIPIAVALLYLLVLTAFFSGWTWSLYDELAWVDIHARQPDVTGFILDDFLKNGRIRPLSSVIVYLKFFLLGWDPHRLRVERVLEFILAVGLFWRILARNRKIPVLLTAVALGFWIKSPPQLEQLRWMTISELYGIVFFLAALVIRGTNIRARMPISYALLVLCALTKEPFAILLALPAILENRRREAILAAGTSFLFLVFLFLNRHGYSGAGGDGFTPEALREIARQSFVDFAWIFPFIALPFFSKAPPRREELQRSAVFFAFSVGYATLIASRAWAYTYYFAPALLLLGFAVAHFLSAFSDTIASRKLWLAYLALLSLLFPARMAWNWTKVYLASKSREEVISQIERVSPSFPAPPRVGTNCAIDGKGLGYAADLRAKPPLEARTEGSPCFAPGTGFRDCCRASEIVALARECAFFAARVSEAASMGAKELWQNKNWRLFSCSE